MSCYELKVSYWYYIFVECHNFSTFLFLDINKVFSIAPRWMNLENARHFLRLSMSAYGWPFVMYLHCGTGLFRILNNVACCPCFGRPQYSLVLDDNCCFCHMAGVKHISKIEEEDILFASFRNHVFEVSKNISENFILLWLVLVLLKRKID